jgi:tetrapyrrole methylase family protein/MazG family protein
MITVIGLGNERGDLTKRGEEAIVNAAKNGAPILVRTALTNSYQSVLELGVPHRVLDDMYTSSQNFATLTKKLVKTVVDSGENAVYLVDGNVTEDVSAKALIKRLHGKVQIIDGVSKIAQIARAANIDGCSYTVVSAYEIFDEAASGTLSLPLIVYDLDDRAFAGDCKLLLGDLFGEETPVKLVQAGKAKKIALYELDRAKAYDYTTAVVIEKTPLLDKKRFTLNDLHEIVMRLRAPDGCPWDRVQTHESIKMSAVEEAYELVDAIDLDDDEKILEEAGDLALQVIFHAVMREEMGAFNLTDVLTGVCQKLISRHTHVFGEDKATDGESALSVWEKNKMVEKNQVTFADAVNDVPKCFPAAMRAQKVGKRAAKGGMDFATAEDAATRLKAEIDEFFEAYKAGDAIEAEKEIGDVLFAAVNVGRKAGCDCEKALKEATDRFAARFTKAEALALADGKVVTELSEAEWDEYYMKAKKALK